MINLEQIAEKAGHDIADGNGYPPEVDAVLKNIQITSKMSDVVASDSTLLIILGTNKKSLEVLRVLCAWYWQMGRLYGQQETIDQYLEGKVK